MSHSLHEPLAVPLSEDATLFLSTPLAHTESALRSAFDQVDVAVEEPYRGVLSIKISPESAQAIGASLCRLLSGAERLATKCRVGRQSAEPSLAELMQSQTLDSFLSWLEGQWLWNVLRGGSLVTYFQPIVRTAEPDEVFGYECLLRARQGKGALIAPDRLYSAARATGLLNALDLLARLTAIRTAAWSHLETKVFINFNPRSIHDPARCLESTVRATEAANIAPGRLVFEIVESDQIEEPEQLLRILEYYREAGYQVALDDLGAGYSSLNLLAQLRPDFVKLDMDLIRDVDRDTYKARVVAKVLELARELNIGTVVEGVETDAELAWAAEHGADYAQGYLFAKPQAEPPIVRYQAGRAEGRRPA